MTTPTPGGGPSENRLFFFLTGGAPITACGVRVGCVCVCVCGGCVVKIK